MADLAKKIFVVAVLAFVGMSLWRDHVESKNSVAWPSTNGEILNSHIKEVTDRDSRGNNGYAYSRTYFTIVLEYTYNVDGVPYQGKRLKIGGVEFSSESKALEFIRSYMPGAKVKVYYDQKMPFKSVLIPG